jgi:hypothetical protein
MVFLRNKFSSSCWIVQVLLLVFIFFTTTTCYISFIPDITVQDSEFTGKKVLHRELISTIADFFAVTDTLCSYRKLHVVVLQ